MNEEIANYEIYEKHLEQMRKYREKYKAIKLEKQKTVLFNKINGVDYRILKINGKDLYVTIDGRFIKFNGQEIIGHKNHLGYITVSCYGRKYQASRIMWEAFNGEIPVGMEIDHINTIRDDNRLENLRMVTHKENCNNPLTIENYRKRWGNDNSCVEEKIYQYSIDGELIKEWGDINECCKNSEFSKQGIEKCCRGKLYTYKDFFWLNEKLNKDEVIDKFKNFAIKDRHGKNNPMYGKKHNDASKEKMRQSALKRYAKLNGVASELASENNAISFIVDKGLYEEYTSWVLKKIIRKNDLKYE